MATRLKQFRFTGRLAEKFPWKKWTDGSIWKIQEGVDYETTCERMRCNLYNMAKTMGLSIQTSVVDKKKTIVFQFSQGTFGKLTRPQGTEAKSNEFG